jgi:hypothetical protein
MPTYGHRSERDRKNTHGQAHTHTQSHHNGEGDKRFNGEGRHTHSKDMQDRGSCGSASVGAGGDRAPNGGGSVSRVCKATERSYFCDGCECLRPLLSTLLTALRVTCDERTGVGVCDGKPHTCELLGENLLGGGVACRHDAVQCSSGVSIYRRSLSSSLLFSRSRHNFVKRTSSRPLHTPRVQRSRSQTPSRQALQNEQEHANGRRAVPCEVTPRHE